MLQERDTARALVTRSNRAIEELQTVLELEQASGRILKDQRDNAEERAGIHKRERRRGRWIKYGAAAGAILAAAAGAPAWVIVIIAAVPAGEELLKK